MLLNTAFSMLANMENSKGNTRECSNCHKIDLISHASKVMLKILHTRLQQYTNQKLPDVEPRKGRGTRDQTANICWITEKAREFQINIYFCFIDYNKAFDCVKVSLRDGNTRPPYLPPEKPVCRSRSNSQNRTWNNKLVLNWEMRTSRLYTVTLLTSMQSTFSKMSGWMKLRLESRLPGEYQ